MSLPLIIGFTCKRNEVETRTGSVNKRIVKDLYKNGSNVKESEWGKNYKNEWNEKESE